MAAGVCGGIGIYFGIDPTIIRIIWAICAFSGVGLVAYIIAAIVIPEESESSYSYDTGHGEGSNEFKSPISFDNRNTNLIIGGILVFLGVILIARRYMPWFDSKLIWSLVLIGLGLLVIFRSGRKR
jgi:phage shock protein C